MPGGVQDLLIKVETVHADLFLLPFAASANFSWLQHRLRLNDIPGRFQRYILFRVSIKYSEKVIIATGHYRAILAVPTALKLVENAVVLIQRAQLSAQVFMNLKRITFLVKI